MRNQALFTLIALFIFTSAQADCIFQSFVVGDDFGIGNMLEWKTEVEQGSKIFLIEKSLNGADFKTIGEVDAKGETDEVNTYTFLDLGAQKGRSFYRVKQVDILGGEAVSHIVAVQKEKANLFMVSKLEYTDKGEQIDISINTNADQGMSYVVANMKGEVLKDGAWLAAKGLSDISIDLKDMTEGTYRIILTSGEEQEQLTILKTTPADTKVPVASSGK